MLPYQSLISFDEKINIPMYRYIANRLIALIQQGKLMPGTFLPGTREMAAMINVHRNTVINAYNELISQGWLEAINRKGFQVIPELPIVKPRSFHPEQKYSVPPPQNTGEFIDSFTDFRFIPATTRRPDIIVNDGFPDITLAPVDELMREYRKTMKGDVMKGLLAEKQYAGNDDLRQATALFLNQTRGLNISAPNILITRGAQMAIYIAASLLLKPGDEVIVSNPSYFIADGIFQNKGARINYIPVDQDGIDVYALEELLQRKKIKLLYVIPHHHHPTTVTLSASRRIKLLNLIQRYKLWVIEDDYDYDFHYHNSPILPLASADHSGQIIYIGSYTKILAPSFRIGYMVTGKEMINQASSYKRLIDIGGDTVMEMALAGLINSGELGRHIKRSKKIYKSRCELAAKLLQAELDQVLSFQKPQGGMAFWLKFFDEYPLEHVLQKAAQAGVLLAGAAYYKGANSNFNHIRFGFASLTDDELNRVVQTLVNATK